MKKQTQKTKSKKTPKKGKVYLVGAGPGDPGLLTLRGKELIQRADAIVYDWLVSPALLLLSDQAEMFDVGKREKSAPGNKKLDSCARQKKINELLVKLAKQGKQVVRLKGGDPFVFGRGGEEATHLHQYRVDFEVIPGVTAGCAVPAYAGIPVTDRRFSSQVVFITAHESNEKKATDIDWEKLAGLRNTIVCFMSVRGLPRVVKHLVECGKKKKTPVCVIQWGTVPEQVTVTGTLEDIVEKVRKKKITSPATAVIGDVVKLRSRVKWYENKPLFSKSVLIVRPASDSSIFKDKLEYSGARVLEVPLIQIQKPKSFRGMDRVIENLSMFQWMVFGSANGVKAFFNRLNFLGLDARALARVKVAVVGESAERELEKRGLKPDLHPAAHSKDLIDLLHKKCYLRGQKIVLPRTDIAPPYLTRELEALGAIVTEVEAYRTIYSGEGKRVLRETLKAEAPDYVMLTSSSTVDAFFKSLTPKQKQNLKSKLVSIGPMTSASIRKYSKRTYIQAHVSTLDGMIAAISSKKKQR